MEEEVAVAVAKEVDIGSNWGSLFFLLVRRELNGLVVEKKFWSCSPAELVKFSWFLVCQFRGFNIPV